MSPDAWLWRPLLDAATSVGVARTERCCPTAREPVTIAPGFARRPAAGAKDADVWPVLRRDHEDGSLEPLSDTATDVLAQLLLYDPEPQDEIDPDGEWWFTPAGSRE